jgi:hypothetical protein
MTGQADIAAAHAGNPVEDQRRDEVLCRLLNTPYRPIERHAKARDGERARMPAAETPVKA